MLFFRIERVYRVKVVAKDWFGNGEKVGVSGKFEFIQETPFSTVSSFIMLKGLEGVAKNYHVHEVGRFFWSSVKTFNYPLFRYM